MRNKVPFSERIDRWREKAGVPDLPMILLPIAGQQYYDRASIDLHNGDRLELVRSPVNRHDANAVEVRWRNGQYMLGHVSADVAEYIAPLMDDGHLITAFCVSAGSGDAWSGMIAIAGDGIERIMDDVSGLRVAFRPRSEKNDLYPM